MESKDENEYLEKAKLAMRLMKVVMTLNTSVVKGGTVINNALQDAPRYSVDIDLTYLHESEYPLEDMTREMLGLRDLIKQEFPGHRVKLNNPPEGHPPTIKVRLNETQVKIEISRHRQGCLHKPEIRETQPNVRFLYGTKQMKTASRDDVYAGKIKACLERGASRDLFDVMVLLDKDGICDSLERTVVFYLVTDRKPIQALLPLRPKKVLNDFEESFDRMTEEPVDKADLIHTHKELIEEVGKILDKHRQFILDFYRCKADWVEFGLPQAANMLCVRKRQDQLMAMTEPEREANVKDVEVAMERMMPKKDKKRRKGPDRGRGGSQGMGM